MQKILFNCALSEVYNFGLKQLSEAVLLRKSGYFKGKLEILINNY